jgi:hypothetical protein
LEVEPFEVIPEPFYGVIAMDATLTLSGSLTQLRATLGPIVNQSMGLAKICETALKPRVEDTSLDDLAYHLQQSLKILAEYLRTASAILEYWHELETSEKAQPRAR